MLISLQLEPTCTVFLHTYVLSYVCTTAKIPITCYTGIMIWHDNNQKFFILLLRSYPLRYQFTNILGIIIAKQIIGFAVDMHMAFCTGILY